MTGRKTRRWRLGGPGLLMLLAWGWADQAQAGLRVGGSAGLGVQVSAPRGLQAGNLMGTIGYEFLGLLRPELGVAGSLETWRAGRGGHGGLELRPMLVIKPPLLPLYGRLTFSGIDPFSPRRRAVAYGASLGLELGLMGVGLLAEAGVLPRRLDSRLSWVLEARLGLVVSLS